MIRHVILFVATFALGAAAAFLVRAARHDVHADAPPARVAAPRVQPMVSEPARPAAPAPAAPAPSDAHAGHDHATAPSPATPAPLADAGTGTVNTVCAICGMDVDPSLGTATYQGKRVGFGCGVCPEIFAAEPDRYGPYALRNEVAND